MSWQALNWCAALHHVRGPRRAVLWALSNRHNHRTGFASMGLTGIAAEAGLSRSVAHRTIHALVGEGLLVVVMAGRGPNSASLYALPAVTVPPERDGSPGLSTGMPIQPGTVPLRRDGSPDATVPLRRDGDEIGASVAHKGDGQPSHSGGTVPSHFQPQPSHSGGTALYKTKEQPSLDQDRTVVTQEPAAALAPDGAAAKQQGAQASVVPRSPDGRAIWRAALDPADIPEPSPNGRDPPAAAG